MPSRICFVGRQRPHARKQREAPHRRLRDQPFPDKPFDDWQVKRALLDYLKNCPSISLAVPREDVEIARVKDLKKRKRDEPLASDIELTLDPRAYCNSSEAPRNGCSRRGRREPDAIVLEGFLRGGFPSKAIIVDYTYYLPGICKDHDYYLIMRPHGTKMASSGALEVKTKSNFQSCVIEVKPQNAKFLFTALNRPKRFRDPPGIWLDLSQFGDYVPGS
ncbi:hypothetical protein SAY87_031493 [Trapa incisa]|uniref:Uncharacterized protein n=1 Tax=Trapa incisa TaxID=236973 RepID=A0AAN7KX96_9MYRT|nr:hypothetical protein SAY87_031493 [Trapa incisa]